MDNSQLLRTLPPLPLRKRIALIAHDGKKEELIKWAILRKDLLGNHELFATGTTGKVIFEAVKLPVVRFESGPYGGDQQIGARIVEHGIDVLFFFWDPLSAQPHDPDVKALLRIAALYDLPVACNRSTADFLLQSPMMTTEYSRRRE